MTPEKEEALMWLATVATATAGEMPRKIKSGVIRKPPPMPNMPEMKPTASPIPKMTKTFTGRSAIGRKICTGWSVGSSDPERRRRAAWRPGPGASDRSFQDEGKPLFGNPPLGDRPCRSCVAAVVGRAAQRPGVAGLDVPARGLGLIERGPALRRRLGGGEGGGVETPADVVAFAGRFLVALARRQAEPFVGLRQVRRHANAAAVQYSEIVLAVGEAVVGRLAEPFGGVLIVWLAVDALGIEHREIVHRLGVAGFRRRRIQTPRHVEVLLDPEALLVEGAKPELC